MTGEDGMPIYGADISGHQRGFDFGAYAGAGHRWICIKQTEGLTWPDQDDPEEAALLRTMRDDAHAAGLAVILYHFIRPQPGRTGRQEAEHFLSFIGDLRTGEGVMIDDEWEGALKGEAHEDFVLDFLDTVEERHPELRGKVLYYSYAPYLAQVSTARCATRMPLWIAAYGPNDGGEHPDSVKLDRWPRYTIWQFTSNRQIAGFGGGVDYNRLEVPLEDLVTGETVRGVRPTNPFLPLGEDGEFGPQTIKALQWTCGVATDGDFGPESERALQRRLGVPVDGDVGPVTITALQKHIGAAEDGLLGPDTVRALQKALNGGTF
ncbi:MAG TPA: GH25 family lysozyme [Acidimicrobiales bacterium]|nr:GH25 family lysozyme [Acidimicrobiales bacterium]